jgi:transposase
VPGPEQSRDQLIDQLRAENAGLRADNQRLRAENEDLTGRLARLERLISRNSSNSSMPPSLDDLPGRTPPVPRPPGGTKRGKGKQKGAPGAALSPVEHPARRVPAYPKRCGGCQAGLDPLVHEAAGMLARQQIDIPLVTATVTEYQLHSLRCGCGHVTRAELPAGVADAPISIGPNLQTLAVYLLVVHAIPVERTCQVIADLTGAKVSAGFVHGMLARAAALLEAFETLTKMLIILAYVVHFDETTLRAGGKGTKQYVWTASTTLYTSYYLGDRSGASFRASGIGPNLSGGVIVHDRLDLYDRQVPAGVSHQLCGSHLVRDLDSAAEDYPGAHWPAQARRAMLALNNAAHAARASGAGHIPAAILDKHTLDLRRAVRVGLAGIPRRHGPRNSTRQHPGRCLLEVFRDREQDVLRYARDLRVPFTNNLAERDLRPWKTVQKISGRLQSSTAARHRLTIRGYISTAIKHGLDAMTVLRDAILGTPWMPPIPMII